MAGFPRWRRRTFLVNRRMQFRFIFLLLLQMSIILTALGLLVHSHVARVGEIALDVPMVDAPAHLALENELIDNVHGFYVRSLGLLGATVLLLVLFGLLASHKLAGPVLKLERYLNAVADGDYSQRIAFRRNDHLDELAQSVNRTAASFEDRRDRTRILAQQLALASGELGERGGHGRAVAEMDEILAELRRVV